MSGVDDGDVDNHDNGDGDWVDDGDTNANANFEKCVLLGCDGMRKTIELDTKADFPISRRFAEQDLYVLLAKILRR